MGTFKNRILTQIFVRDVSISMYEFKMTVFFDDYLMISWEMIDIEGIRFIHSESELKDENSLSLCSLYFINIHIIRTTIFYRFMNSYF